MAQVASLRRDADYMTFGRCTVEHPFGTIKARTGSAHFLTLRLTNARMETALNVLANDIKRIVALLCVGGLIGAILGRSQ